MRINDLTGTPRFAGVGIVAGLAPALLVFAGVYWPGHASAAGDVTKPQAESVPRASADAAPVSVLDGATGALHESRKRRTVGVAPAKRRTAPRLRNARSPWASQPRRVPRALLGFERKASAPDIERGSSVSAVVNPGDDAGLSRSRACQAKSAIVATSGVGLKVRLRRRACK
jgi:hypothetical protein